MSFGPRPAKIFLTFFSKAGAFGGKSLKDGLITPKATVSTTLTTPATAPMTGETDATNEASHSAASAAKNKRVSGRYVLHGHLHIYVRSFGRWWWISFLLPCAGSFGKRTHMTAHFGRKITVFAYIVCGTTESPHTWKRLL
jgi:hypothetical protein